MAKPDVIKIEKSLVPYKFNILLAGEVFELHIKHNSIADLFTIDLYKDDELICAGEPIIYGSPLWGSVYKAGLFPAVTIVPKDPSGEANRVTYDNLCDTVLLVVDNGVDGS